MTKGNRDLAWDELPHWPYAAGWLFGSTTTVLVTLKIIPSWSIFIAYVGGFFVWALIMAVIIVTYRRLTSTKRRRTKRYA